MISHGDFSGYKPEDLYNTYFISGHFGYYYARSLMATRYSFTILCDPVERVLSIKVVIISPYFLFKIYSKEQVSENKQSDAECVYFYLYHAQNSLAI